jgi:hypothetical protein
MTASVVVLGNRSAKFFARRPRPIRHPLRTIKIFGARKGLFNFVFGLFRKGQNKDRKGVETKQEIFYQKDDWGLVFSKIFVGPLSFPMTQPVKFLHARCLVSWTIPHFLTFHWIPMTYVIPPEIHILYGTHEFMEFSASCGSFDRSTSPDPWRAQNILAAPFCQTAMVLVLGRKNFSMTYEKFFRRSTHRHPQMNRGQNKKGLPFDFM